MSLRMLFQVEGRGVGDTHITGRHFGGDTHITSDMCVGTHISRGYTNHCDTAFVWWGLKWWRHVEWLLSLLPSSPPSVFPGILFFRESVGAWRVVFDEKCLAFVGDLVVENAFINWLSHPLLLSLTFQGGGKLTYDFFPFCIYYKPEVKTDSRDQSS